MKKIIFAPVLFLLSVGFTPSLVFAYSDISLENSLYPALEYLTTKKFVNGYSDGTFRPSQPINRAEALKMILVAAETPLLDEGELLSDVPEDAWFAPYVRFAQARGIVSGNEDGLFVPDRQVNRAEFLKMLLGAFDVNPSDYELNVQPVDAPQDAWFAPHVRFATEFNIIEMDGFQKVYPAETLTRGGAATLLYKTLKVGQGLDAQTLLTLTENHLVSALETLQQKNMFQAGLHVQSAQYFSKVSQGLLPDNEIVIAAHNTTSAVNNLVGAYVAAENVQLEDVITAAKNAWSFADKIHMSGGPNLMNMALEIKELAGSIANKARELQKTLNTEE